MTTAPNQLPAPSKRPHPGIRHGTPFLPLCLALVLAMFLLGGPAVSAAERASIMLASGFEMQVQQFPANGQSLLIWIPSKYGIRPGNQPFAEKIQAEGLDYWLVELHASYGAPTGRYSYPRFKPQHIMELIDHAAAQGWQQIVLGGESRGAALAMRAAREWQLRNPGNPALKGFVFYHPYLIQGQTPIGEQARFLPIARATNLPTYIFQPQHTTKSLYSHAILEQLEIGGAPVYFHPVPGVRGGYHVRDADRLNDREIEEFNRVGERIDKAVDLLARLPTPQRAAKAATSEAASATGARHTKGRLARYEREELFPLKLYDDNSRLVDLEDYRGEVVLVNYWASWCGPCVREIASLMRLIGHFDDQPFRVLTVNIGESPQHVAEFFDHLGIEPNFDVLFDPTGEAAKAWRIYAVPSTYLIDSEQRVRYAYRGALEWDKPSVVTTIQSLLE